MASLVATVAFLLGNVALAGGAPGVASAATDPIGVHSMLQLNSPYSFMQAMFAQAAGLHATSLRLDVAPALIFTSQSQPPDFSGLDEVMALSQQYKIPVVADLLTIPAWLADCQTPADANDPYRCGTTDLAGYRSVITQIVAHADPVIRDWEIWNEPDTSSFFTGTPQQYALMLRTAHDAIKAVDPQASVLLGGISGTSGMGWLAQVFATPGADAAHAFDIANIHERGLLDNLAGDIRSWRWFLAGYGFDGPLWVTEHGYPSDPASQYDPSYVSGLASQASYLSASIPTMVDAGASEVFVTERDNLGGPFASEGLLGGAVSDSDEADPTVIEKPAYAAVRTVGDCYAALGRDCPGSPPAASPASPTIPTTRLRSSMASTVSVSDPGPGPLQLGTVALAGAGSGAAGGPITVQSDGCSNQLLEPDQRCAIALRFSPVAGGSVSATLQVPSGNGTLSVPVSAVAPSVSSLASVQTNPAFASAGAGSGTGELQRLDLELVNPLMAPVHIIASALTGSGARRFVIESDQCGGAVLAPGAQCRVSVLFTPTRPGTARATLTLRGDGTPLSIPIRAMAYAPPAVTQLASTKPRPCFAGVSSNRILVRTDEPSSMTWHLRRRNPALDPSCRLGPSVTGSASVGGRSFATGRTATGRRPVHHHRARKYVARFALPVAPGRRGLRPGTYQLTITATNAHGAGRPRTMLVTVLP